MATHVLDGHTSGSPTRSRAAEFIFWSLALTLIVALVLLVPF